jgi:hypothetical protein
MQEIILSDTRSPVTYPLTRFTLKKTHRDLTCRYAAMNFSARLSIFEG